MKKFFWLCLQHVKMTHLCQSSNPHCCSDTRSLTHCATRELLESNFLIKKKMHSSHCGSGVTNLASIQEDVGSIPGLAQWVKDIALM